MRKIAPTSVRAAQSINQLLLGLDERKVGTTDFCMVLSVWGDRGSTVVKVLRQKSEGRCFDPSWCHWNFSLT